MRKIAGISGKIGAGKTTLVDILYKKILHKVYTPEIKNFADKLKRICFELTGYYGYTQEEKNIFIPEYNNSIGSILQILGTEVLREHFDNDIWIKATFISMTNPHIYLIGDCRFTNEADYIINNGGIVVRLNGDPAKVRENSNRDLNHISETDLDNYNKFSLVYENTGSLEELELFADKVIDLLKI